MKKNNIIFHIGYPKCASSLLQNQLFSNAQDHLLIAAENLKNTTGKVEINALNKDVFLYQKILDYVDGKVSLKNDIISSLKKRIKEYNGKVIFSSEWITSSRYVSNSPLERVKLLSQIIPVDSKIIIVIRNQSELINSLYRDNQLSFKNNRYLSLDNFVNEILEQNLIRNFFYTEIYDFLNTKFGSNNIFLYKISGGDKQNICKLINNDIKVVNNKILKNISINEGMTNYQFIYLTTIRRLIFLKNIIPERIYSLANEVILKLLKFGKKHALKQSLISKSKIEQAFSNDWNYVIERTRN